jgi:hypothetical protein
LKLAWNKGFRKVFRNSDSIEAIRLLTVSEVGFHKYRSIIRDIRRLMAWNWDVRIQHTYREANACADFIAKLAASNDQGFTVWDVSPEGIAGFLLADQLGTSFPILI